MQRVHPSHTTRFSDSSLYDEVCTQCGAEDGSAEGSRALALPCPKSRCICLGVPENVNGACTIHGDQS